MEACFLPSQRLLFLGHSFDGGIALLGEVRGTAGLNSESLEWRLVEEDKDPALIPLRSLHIRLGIPRRDLGSRIHRQLVFHTQQCSPLRGHSYVRHGKYFAGALVQFRGHLASVPVTNDDAAFIDPDEVRRGTDRADSAGVGDRTRPRADVDGARAASAAIRRNQSGIAEAFPLLGVNNQRRPYCYWRSPDSAGQRSSSETSNSLSLAGSTI